MKISEIILRKLDDPRISSVTITNVELSNDLKHARIFFSCLGSKDDEKKTIKGLQNATNYIKSIIGHELGLRYVPELRFEFDEFFRQSVKIVDLIDKIEKNEID